MYWWSRSSAVYVKQSEKILDLAASLPLAFMKLVWQDCHVAIIKSLIQYALLPRWCDDGVWAHSGMERLNVGFSRASVSKSRGVWECFWVTFKVPVTFAVLHSNRHVSLSVTSRKGMILAPALPSALKTGLMFSAEFPWMCHMQRMSAMPCPSFSWLNMGVYSGIQW